MKKQERAYIDEKGQDLYTRNNDYVLKKRMMQWFVRLIRLDMAYTAEETELPSDSRRVYKTDRTKEIKKNKQRKENI